ncbi:hypothetical protein PPACK8108_LOCUS11149 [Phakopsora pachyrhizi]|uniref:Uncharacterized protein n=1 Tax=Phakopsora pachyrhizi TaxID=170000 RepID=A0AAV0AJ92_PHAPC|nr:hypothetical protein PPACK8108_LOCUS3068 [Phakopsora pachyrhizi]CAH7676045.1 hypothetical protein PPACK8108_LOCUS11149 [Phakopsora pachyrhizi]
MLQLFSSPFPLELEGGPSNLAMIMDWREMIGIRTINQSQNFNKQQQQQASLRPWANGNYIHSKLIPPSSDRKLSRINSEIWELRRSVMVEKLGIIDLLVPE